ncbi:ShlB/FhaC/HecB family hemolysin secretion/activation protein [Saccharospirillum sp. MSK14-1]|uniref:ShlB/FhaC/HecB family hemolysin secretion/activation protein n=1 Tax=Saccharospirillum sp. MSK14-1 TaxID=1897632 RepID=UPI0011B26608|nr:ShlB/FhaC/HecB family hemolysin secretion/activation protein [Saccharospirillum sp. MSK14-1]
MYDFRKGCISASAIARALISAVIMLMCVEVKGELPKPEQESLDQQRRFEEWQRQQNERFQPDPDVFFDTPEFPSLDDDQLLDGTCFPIAKIQLVSAENKQFRWLEKHLNSRLETDGCLDAKDINRLMAETQNDVISAGYVTTRLVAEAQDLNSGLLTFTLLPGYVEDIRFADGAPRRATVWNALPIRSGDVLNLRHLEQGLENLKRVPSVAVNIDIEPGEQPGYSDLVIQWQQQKPLRVTETLDNSGSENTGRYQSSVTLSYDPYWAFNDLSYVTYVQSIVFAVGQLGSQSFSAHYSVPYRYWLLSLNGGYSENFQTIKGETGSYKYAGTSSNQSVKLERIMFRSGHQKVTASFSVKASQSESFINDVEIDVQHRRRRKMELALQHHWFLSKATLDASLIYKRGITALGASEDPEVKAGYGVKNPQWLMLDINYSQPFKFVKHNWVLGSRLQVQGNLTPLIPLDQMLLGSDYSVRGFDQGISGESAAYLHNDLVFVVPKISQQITLGFDAGTVFDHGAVLAGASLGFKGQVLGVTYEASISRPLLSPAGLEPESSIYAFQLSKAF